MNATSREEATAVHRRALALLALLLATLLLAGCGGDDDGADEARPDTAAEQDAAATEAEEPAELTPVQFQLAWVASANAMPYIVADGQGYYEEEGLDLEIVESQDPTAVIGLVGSGERQIGVSYPPDILLGVANDVPIRSVWAQYQVNPLGIVSLEATGIESPEDLVGKRIGLTPLPIDQALFDAMLADGGIQRGQLDVVDAGFNGGTLVGEGRLDGASGVPWFEVAALRVAGENPRLLQYREHGGLDFPFQAVIVNSDWAEENREAVEAFVRATVRGHEYAVENPDEAVDMVMEAYPQLERAWQEQMWEESIPLAESELTEEHGIGYLDVEQLQRLSDFLRDRGVLTRDVDAAAVFTNEYQPEG